MSGPRTLEDLGLPSSLAETDVSESIRAPAGGAAEPRGGPLELLDVIGRGGMGVVHRARDPSLDREVAVKRLRDDAPSEAAARLIEEARVLGMLEHPAVVPVHSLRVDASGRPELVMKRIEGQTWRAVAREGRDVRFHVETTIALSYALELAHTRGVVHRDIKPANVMIGAFGETYLLDWGVAMRLDAPTTELAGTPAYMAPEMLVHEPISERTDVYLLAGALFEALTGAPPHPGASFLEVATHALEGLPLDVGDHAPASLEAILRRATARRPEDRHPSMRALREELQGFLEHQSSLALLDAARPRAERFLDADADERARRLAFAEARFGLQQALRIWPESPDAAALLDRVVRAMIDLELSVGRVEAAEALAAEHAPDDAALSERIDARRRARDAARARRASLEAAAREGDLRVGARRRFWLVALFGAGTLALTAVGHLFFRRALDYPFLFGQQAAIAAGGAALMLAVLGVRAPNAAAHRYRLALGAVVGSLLVATAVGWRLAVPIGELVFLETAALLPLLALLAIAIDPRAWIAAGAVAVGVAIGLLVEPWRYASIQLAQLGGLAALLVAWALFDPPSLDVDRRGVGEGEGGAADPGLAADERDSVEPGRGE